MKRSSPRLPPGSLKFILLSILILQTSCAYFTKNRSSYSIERDVVFKRVDNLELKGDIYEPEGIGLKQAVVVVHGGGWERRSGDMELICQSLARAGIVAFNITYRLAPENLFPKDFEDVRDAVRWLRANAKKYTVDPNSISGWGYSAGAHLVMLVGLDPAEKMKSIVTGGTPADLTQWPNSPIVYRLIGKTYEEAPQAWKDASPIYRIQPGSPPVFMYHGRLDMIIEFDQMLRMKAALEAKHVHVETLEVPWTGHFGTYLFSHESVDKGIEFIQKN